MALVQPLFQNEPGIEPHGPRIRAAKATTESGRESIVLGLGQPHDVVSFSFCGRRLPNEANGPKRREAKELFRELGGPVERPLLSGVN